MNRRIWKLLLGDAVIILIFALIPGIRGYSDWHIYEYILFALLAAILIFEWHKKNRQSEAK
jgi:hypothetical protein